MLKAVRFVRKLVNILFSRIFLYVLLMLVQIAFLTAAVILLSEHFLAVYLFLMMLDIALVVYIINTSENPSYKLPWMVAMLIIPLMSGIAYILIKSDIGHRIFKRNYANKVKETAGYIPQDESVVREMRQQDAGFANLSCYLQNYGGYPVYRNRTVQYFFDGMDMFTAVKEEIRRARRYIFLEFFIIHEGTMWEEVLTLLKEKASQGVDIRIFYDGFGTQLQMPRNYFAHLKQYGIQCRVFNGFKPFLSTSQNNRDHRKILVIDGSTAFTGGINLADEYINRKKRFGHWKDGGMMCRGEAAWSFTVMFLQLWELDNPNRSELDAFRPLEQFSGGFDGFIQPYSDSPTDEEYVGRCVYLDIINNAKKYIYIMTPYLIPDYELITALGLAAKKGVDVRLITPHVPDKWYAYETAWSYYQELLNAGVRIFEYEPGFIHAKNFLADDTVGVVGSINLDYRSLYLHFECAAVMYGCSMLLDIRRDFEQTLAQSIEIHPADCIARPILKRLIGWILRVFAPLL